MPLCLDCGGNLVYKGGTKDAQGERTRRYVCSECGAKAKRRGSRGLEMYGAGVKPAVSVRKALASIPERPPEELEVVPENDTAAAKLIAAKVRKERALAARYEVDNRIRRGQLVDVATVRDAFALAAASIRTGIDGLRQAFGERAAKVMEDALEKAEDTTSSVLSD